jgi:hypothetical protein
MLSQHTVGNAYNVCRNLVHRLAEPRKSPMDDHEVAVGHDHSWPISEFSTVCVRIVLILLGVTGDPRT